MRFFFIYENAQRISEDERAKLIKMYASFVLNILAD